MSAPTVDLRALVAALEADPEHAARLARVIAPFVFAAAVTASKASGGTFSSRKGHAAPGLSDEENKRIARIIGVQRGRWWHYTQADLDAYERRGAEPVATASADDAPWHPRMAAAALGLRGSR